MKKYLVLLIARSGSILGDEDSEQVDAQRRFLIELNAGYVKKMWVRESAASGAIEACVEVFAWTAQNFEDRFRGGTFHPKVVLAMTSSEEPPPAPKIPAAQRHRRIDLQWGYSHSQIKELLKLVAADAGSTKVVNYQLPTLSNKPSLWVTFPDALSARQFDCRIKAKMYPPIVKAASEWDGKRPVVADTEPINLLVRWERDEPGLWLKFVNAAELHAIAGGLESARIDSVGDSPELRILSARDVDDNDYWSRLRSVAHDTGADIEVNRGGIWINVEALRE
ncbi:MAG: hypothetical protein AB7G11_12715 [Phycisphaerales bacterium]